MLISFLNSRLAWKGCNTLAVIARHCDRNDGLTAIADILCPFRARNLTKQSCYQFSIPSYLYLFRDAFELK